MAEGSGTKGWIHFSMKFWWKWKVCLLFLFKKLKALFGPPPVYILCVCIHTHTHTHTHTPSWQYIVHITILHVWGPSVGRKTANLAFPKMIWIWTPLPHTQHLSSFPRSLALLFYKTLFRKHCFTHGTLSTFKIYVLIVSIIIIVNKSLILFENVKLKLTISLMLEFQVSSFHFS